MFGLDERITAVSDGGSLADASLYAQHPTGGRVANGDNNTMMITENTHLLAHHLPNAQLRIYPDSGHGFLDQYPTLFADHVTAFLNGG